ncbi:regulator of microtubule dynamics protein 3-like isoform X2 [Tachypleus tridentatus]|uniref:regulator of microtubule dynamics protein 3-like isoform X2 n=1 Tax=Tachypleus tridentatus TaxID=6853 RepID=UPI003FD22792
MFCYEAKFEVERGVKVFDNCILWTILYFIVKKARTGKMSGILRNKLTLVVVFGTGVFISINSLGLYVCYILNKAIRRELSDLTSEVRALKQEFKEVKSVLPVQLLRKRISEPNLSRVDINVIRTSETRIPSSIASGDDGEESEIFYEVAENELLPNDWTYTSGSIELLNTVGDVSEQDFFRDIDQSLEGSTEERQDAYATLSSRKNEFEGNAEYLWRLAKAAYLCGIIAENHSEPEKKKDFAFEAFHYGKQALEAEPSIADVQKWYAITLGNLSDYVSTQEKIQNGFEFKVAILSWWERKLASTLITALPESSLDIARMHLLKADSLKPDWKENILFIAKTFIGEGNYTSAMEWIDKAVELKVLSDDDEMAHIELEALQAKYNSYRA